MYYRYGIATYYIATSFMTLLINCISYGDVTSLKIMKLKITQIILKVQLSAPSVYIVCMFMNCLVTGWLLVDESEPMYG